MILITGDTHGDVTRFANTAIRRVVDDRDLSTITHSIILGDFGLIWTGQPSNYETYWLKWLDEKPYETLVVRGNHEHHERLDNLPQEERYGAPVFRVSEKVFIFQHGNKYTIDNKTFFVMGGADSIDKEHRVNRISWWHEEIPTVADFHRGMATCDENNFTFDYVLSHTAPISAVNELKRINPSTFFEGSDYYELKGGDPTTKMLEAFVERMQCKRWFFGHFHDNTDFTCKGINYSLLYGGFKKID
jgi:predicted phosphodiesterase